MTTLEHAGAAPPTGVPAPAPTAEHGDPYRAFRDELFAAGLLVPTGVDGLYLRSEAFESIVRGIDAAVSKMAAVEAPTVYHFPLVVPAGLLERTDYVRSFPDLIGVLDSYAKGEAGYGDLLAAAEEGSWPQHLEHTGLGLCSAACHPLYPTLAGSEIPPAGRRFEIFGQVFRHEPSVDPARQQVFRQHEVVFVGAPADAAAHRDAWVERGLSLHRRLGLVVEAVVANDPFFGRGGRILAANQRAEALKIELVAPICSADQPTAITSANCHLDHFGTAFGLRLGDEVAHSACVGFGLERIALALLAAHGLEFSSWPASVRQELGW
ncbi:MAG: amino acid--[acyl-carrier-protein] ligase [Actinomycetota bacterium]|nr:amino acid--[acyl-carrier-protein] ligase [Actinomycetota bacterium]